MTLFLGALLEKNSERIFEQIYVVDFFYENTLPQTSIVTSVKFTSKMSSIKFLTAEVCLSRKSTRQ